MNSAKRQPKPKRDANWLGGDRERDMAHLHKALEHTHPDDGKTRMRLARECRKVRHGRADISGPTPFHFNLSLAELKIPRIGVH